VGSGDVDVDGVNGVGDVDIEGLALEPWWKVGEGKQLQVK
jgi:hypothetical protein